MSQVQSIKTIEYKEVIQVNVPVRFYWGKDGFDGIEFGPFEHDLLPWETEMIEKCLDAVGHFIGKKE